MKVELVDPIKPFLPVTITIHTKGEFRKLVQAANVLGTEPDMFYNQILSEIVEGIAKVQKDG